MNYEENDFENSEEKIRYESIAAQFIPNYNFSETQNNTELVDDNELNTKFKNLNSLEEDSLDLGEWYQIEVGELWNFTTENNDNLESFNKESDLNSEVLNEPNNLIDEPSDETEIATKMLNYLISIEGIYAPDFDYLDKIQHDITSIMRAILFDWMMEVWNEFTLKRETLYYSINYVDRFLSVNSQVKKEDLQLIGVSAMFIAAKMEEVYSPRVADFAKSTDNGYTVEQIVKMEKINIKSTGLENYSSYICNVG